MRQITAKWQDYARYAGAGNHTVVGNVQILKGFWSPQLKNRRDLLVYLPPSYGASGRHYPVIYMHDGQNLFDNPTSYAGEWQVDETMQALSHEGLEAIVVGVPNTGVHRMDEYTPFRDPHGKGGKGNDYLAFLAETVKPRIDHDFKTLPDRVHTGILGSSLGGLISLYAFFHYSAIFGFAGVMSPSVWFAERSILRYVQTASFVQGRLYVDAGTEEGPPARTDPITGEVFAHRFVTDARALIQRLEQNGYHLGRDLMYVEEQGGIHNEASWARRLPNALRFLLGEEAIT